MVEPLSSYYHVLQVDPEAESEVIDAAYRRLARLYHPDVSKSPNALRKMQEINAAYEVLHDPVKRRQYDESLKRSRKQETTEETQQTKKAETANESAPEDDPLSHPDFPVCCQGCGRSDATLRISIFRYAISVIFKTFLRTWGGVYCVACRRRRMFFAKLLTFFLGWWGIPFGILYTLLVLFEPSEGKVEREANGSYLGALGAYFFSQKRYGDAAQTWEASLTYQPDQKLEGTYLRLLGRRPDLSHRLSHGEVSGAIFGFGTLCIVLIAVLGSLGVIKLSPGVRVNPTSIPIISPTMESTMIPTEVIQPTAIPIRQYVPDLENYTSIEAKFSVSIPKGTIVKVEDIRETTSDPPWYRIIFSPDKNQANSVDVILDIEARAPLESTNSDFYLTEQVLEELAPKWLTNREGWKIISIEGFAGYDYSWVGMVGEGPFGDAGMIAKSYCKIISISGWTYIIEVLGWTGNDEIIAQFYQFVTDSFMIGSRHI